MQTIKMGVIGLGNRGYGLLRDVLLPMPEIEVVAVADKYEDRVKRAQEKCRLESSAIQAQEVQGFTDATEMLEQMDLDAVLVSSSWDTHIEYAIQAMERHVAVAMEVGGAYEIEDLWDLVRCYERTKTPFMLMENCCYGRIELMTLNMVEQGVLGEVVYCRGGYCHDLREEITYGDINRHYRLDNYKKRNAENYPTHEIGPLAKILGINHGNRFLTLSSHSSKAVGLHEYINSGAKAELQYLQDTKFNQGDVVETTISCANGELVSIRLDTSLPRYYSREFLVEGTKGLVNEENRSVFLDGKYTEMEGFMWEKHFNNLEEYFSEYDHPIWKEYLENGVHQGHDGMDWLVFKAFCQSLIENKPMPVDVYDAATWMAITALSEKSIAEGGSPVSFPDFTRGKWIFEQ